MNSIFTCGTDHANLLTGIAGNTHRVQFITVFLTVFYDLARSWTRLATIEIAIQCTHLQFELSILFCNPCVTSTFWISYFHKLIIMRAINSINLIWSNPMKKHLLWSRISYHEFPQRGSPKGWRNISNFGSLQMSMSLVWSRNRMRSYAWIILEI